MYQKLTQDSPIRLDADPVNVFLMKRGTEYLNVRLGYRAAGVDAELGALLAPSVCFENAT
jgi:hypothetical protein